MWVNRSFFSNQMSNVSKPLISLTKNEQQWAIRSGCSEEMSESLISLTKNEWMSESLIFLNELLICSFLGKKQAIHSEIKWANSQPWEIYSFSDPKQSRILSNDLHIMYVPKKEHYLVTSRTFWSDPIFKRAGSGSGTHLLCLVYTKLTTGYYQIILVFLYYCYTYVVFIVC